MKKIFFSKLEHGSGRLRHFFLDDFNKGKNKLSRKKLTKKKKIFFFKYFFFLE